MGSFRPIVGSLHLHRQYNFTEPLVETALKSLRHSCRSNLPDKEFRYLRTVIVTAAIHQGFDSKLPACALTPPVNLLALGRRQPLYIAFRLGRDLCFW